MLSQMENSSKFMEHSLDKEEAALKYLEDQIKKF